MLKTTIELFDTPRIFLNFFFSFKTLLCIVKDPVKKGLEIAQEKDRRDIGFGSQKAKLEMILKDAHGRESKRKIRSTALEVKGDGDKSLIIFDTPRTVKGTKFLSFTHKQGADDQWLFLPKLKRVKRIASNNKSGPFMGSEFAYEDISSQEVEKYTYKYLRDEACGSLTCFVVERTPTDNNSGYSKQIAWIDQTEYRVQKVDFYECERNETKDLRTKGVPKIQK